MTGGARVEDWAEGVASALLAAPRSERPFGHLLFQDLLPRELFLSLRDLNLSASMRNSRPGVGPASREAVRRSVVIDRESRPDAAEAEQPLATAFDVLSHPSVESTLKQRFAAELAVNFGVAAPAVTPALSFFEDRSGYELLPHTDVPHKAVTLLLYLAEDDDDPALGTELFELRNPTVDVPLDIMTMRVPRHHFLPPTTVPYRPNCGVAFAPSNRTFHGVSEVTRPGVARRAIQFQLNVDARTAALRQPVRPTAQGGET